MSYRDVRKYYKDVEAQFFEMKADAEDLQKAVADGFISQERIDETASMTERLRTNYERLSYVMYLFNLPNRKKGRHGNAPDEGLVEFMRPSGEKAVLGENADVLRDFKAFAAKTKKEKEKELACEKKN